MEERRRRVEQDNRPLWRLDEPIIPTPYGPPFWSARNRSLHKESRAAALLVLYNIPFNFPSSRICSTDTFVMRAMVSMGIFFPQHAEDVAVALLLDAFFQALFQALCPTFFRIFPGKASAIITHCFRLLLHFHGHGNSIFCISCQMLQFHGKHGFKFPLAVCFQYNIVRCRAVRCKVKNIRTPPWLTEINDMHIPRNHPAYVGSTTYGCKTR